MEDVASVTKAQAIYEYLRSTVRPGMMVDPDSAAEEIFGRGAHTTDRMAVLDVLYKLAVWGYVKPMRLAHNPKRPRFEVMHPLLPTDFKGAQRKYVGDNPDDGEPISEGDAAIMIAELIGKTMKRIERTPPLSEIPLADIQAELARRVMDGRLVEGKAP